MTNMQQETVDGLKMFGCEIIKTEKLFRGYMVSFKTESRKFGQILVGPNGKVTGSVNGVDVKSYEELLSEVQK